jgi:putative cardiolipin synthase
MFERRFLLAFSLLGFWVGVSSCSVLPSSPDRPVTHALKQATTGKLAEVSRAAGSRFGSKRSGFHLIKKCDEAMLWRLALIDHATSSIDIQYYIWANDAAGWLLFSRLLEAADRGVRVRLLVDDFTFASEEARLAAICQHPNLKVRIFNPQSIRSGVVAPMLEFAARFRTLNRRMHNKLFVVDNRLAILGGRNIGNQYFGMHEGYNFVDLDVLATGRVVADVSRGFDEFWNSEVAYPGLAMSQKPKNFKSVVASIRKPSSERAARLRRAGFPLERRDWSARLRGLVRRWRGGTGVMLQDGAAAGPGEPRRRFLDHAPSIMAPDSSNKDLLAVSPYLVPEKRLYNSLRKHAEDGVRVKLLTASLGSSDQLWVHGHYAKRRRKLLREGAEMYELRRDLSPQIRRMADGAGVKSKRVSLHMKASVGGRKRCFIGSLNLDPRSMKINTENGLMIESPALAEELADYLNEIMSAENSWQVKTRKGQGKGQMEWHAGRMHTTTQPSPGWSSTAGSFFFGLLPIGGQL